MNLTESNFLLFIGINTFYEGKLTLVEKNTILLIGKQMLHDEKFHVLEKTTVFLLLVIRKNDFYFYRKNRLIFFEKILYFVSENNVM